MCQNKPETRKLSIKENITPIISWHCMLELNSKKEGFMAYTGGRSLRGNIEQVKFDNRRKLKQSKVINFFIPYCE